MASQSTDGTLDAESLDRPSKQVQFGSQANPSTSTEFMLKGKGKAPLPKPDVWVVDGVEIELVNEVVESPESSVVERGDLGHEEEELYEEVVDSEEMERMLKMLDEIRLPPSQRHRQATSAKASDLNTSRVAPRTNTVKKSTSGPSPRASLPAYSHADYDPAPSVVYTCDADEANDLLSCLRGDTLGFDMEWPRAGQVNPDGKTVGRVWNKDKKRFDFSEPKTALLQFCDDRMIVLVHIYHMDRESGHSPTEALLIE